MLLHERRAVRCWCFVIEHYFFLVSCFVGAWLLWNWVYWMELSAIFQDRKNSGWLLFEIC